MKGGRVEGEKVRKRKEFQCLCSKKGRGRTTNYNVQNYK